MYKTALKIQYKLHGTEKELYDRRCHITTFHEPEKTLCGKDISYEINEALILGMKHIGCQACIKEYDRIIKESKLRYLPPKVKR